MSRKILLVLGHPRADSFCGQLATAYLDAAKAAGAQTRRLNVGELSFDALGVLGEGLAPPPEPDVLMAQESIRWAEHLVFVYPIWWGTMPALMKGFLERVFATGFAIDFPDQPPYWAPLLKGRSARLITTMNAPPFFFRWVQRAPGHNVMKRAVLRMCGIRPVRISSIGPVKLSTPGRRTQWLTKVAGLGRSDAGS